MASLLHISNVLLLVVCFASFPASAAAGNQSMSSGPGQFPSDFGLEFPVRGSAEQGPSPGGSQYEDGVGGVFIFKWDFEYVQRYFYLCVVLLIYLVIALIWHNVPKMKTVFPESCLLMIFGIIVATIMSYEDVTKCGFPSQNFFVYMLPPIVIHASYDLNHRLFAENVGTILLFALVGTIINFAIIGPVIYGMSLGGWFGPNILTWVQAMYFASFIVAVDPVAVLAIFSEVGVNEVLFYLVFGEALLNDAVTVALFNGVAALQYWENIPIIQWLLFVGYFLAGSCGGFVIGVILGLISSLLVRISHGDEVLDVVTVLVFAWLSNLVPLMCMWSGIYGMVGCALTQAQFCLPTLPDHTRVTVRSMLHTFAYVSIVIQIWIIAESLVFMFMGSELLRVDFHWNTTFSFMALIMCFVGRFVSVVILGNLANLCRVRRIPWNEMIIIWQGGLRGAVCFALVSSIVDDYPVKGMFTSACLFVVYFTSFVMGILTAPVLSLLHIKLSDAHLGVSIWKKHWQPINDRMVAGVEAIIDVPAVVGDNSVKLFAYKIRDKYMRIAFTNKGRRIDHDMDILKAFDMYPEVNPKKRQEYEQRYSVIFPPVVAHGEPPNPTTSHPQMTNGTQSNAHYSTTYESVTPSRTKGTPHDGHNYDHLDIYVGHADMQTKL